MSTDALHEPRPRLWRRFVNLGDLLEWGPLVVAGIVYVVADNPALAVALACLKFAAPDFRTAAWIRAVDPNLPRRRQTAWLHRALGMAKVAFLGIVAIALTGAIFLAIHPVQLGQGRIELLLSQAFGGLFVAIVASLVSGLLAVPGIVPAIRNREKIWVDWRASRARLERSWPPCDSRPGARVVNLLGMVLVGDGIGVIFLAFLLTMETFFSQRIGGPAAVVEQILVGGICLLCCALGWTLFWAARVLPANFLEDGYPELTRGIRVTRGTEGTSCGSSGDEQLTSQSLRDYPLASTPFQ